MIELTNILDRREDDHLEAKSAKGGFPDSFWESYSAFANSDGGVILLGVEERSDHTLYVQEGLADAEKMKDTFWKMVNNRQKVSHNIVTISMVYVAQLEGKDILVVEVPRVERTTRPVYKGLDPRLGTYRRWGEGDHLCSLEEVTTMLRDASSAPLDLQTIPTMDMSVFCEDSVNAYRNVFRSTNPYHLWNQLDNEMFLRRIKAVAMGEDGCYHPTEAGLLMFGYEYEITSRFPQYFLDYQEERVMVGVTRWKDRITSSSGDWSGNLFDFIFKVLPKLQADLKIPFVLKGNQRVDDTPLHKVLREAMVNTLSNADYTGRRGVVITKNKDGFTFANPGNMRISKKEAIEGGVSDPRNSTILKFFSLIRFGERAGSGLNGIMYVWRKVYHTEAEITESTDSVDRTVLTLSFNGNEMDVDAMLQLYDGADELVLSDKSVDLSGKKHEVLPDKTILLRQITDKMRFSGKNSSGLSTTDAFIEKITDIYIFISQHPHSSAEDVATFVERSKESAKKYLQALTAIGMIMPEGGNKNRTYSITQ
ncbi:MAG: RNA-binding domain-containing protein [Bacteroides sp.]